MRYLPLLLFLLPAPAPQDDIRVEEGTGAIARKLHLPNSGYALAASADGKRIAVGVRSRIVVMTPEDGKVVISAEPFKGAVRGLDFSPDGSQLAVAGIGGVGVLNISTGKMTWTTKGHPSQMKADEGGGYTAVFVDDGASLATGSLEEGTVRLWSAKDGTTGATFDTKLGEVRRLAASPDRKRLVASDSKGIVLFDTAGREVWRSKSGGSGSALAFSADGKRLAVGRSLGGSGVSVIDAAEGKKSSLLLSEGEGMICGLAWLDEKRIVCVHERMGGLKVVDTSAPKAKPEVIDADFKGESDADHGLVACGGGLVAVLGRKVVHLYKIK